METQTLKYSTKAQRQMIMGLCQYNIEHKASAALSISNGRTESLSELFSSEASRLIKRLKGEKTTHSTPRHLQFDLSNSKHRKILSICQQLGWSKKGQRQSSIADMEKLNSWLMSKRSPVQKCLMDIDYVSLSKIIHALEQIQLK